MVYVNGSGFDDDDVCINDNYSDRLIISDNDMMRQ
jgi:hypothetical protein